MKDNKLGDKARLQHIFQSIKEINKYTERTDFEMFEQNSMLHNACIRQLEIIGEAANRLSQTLRENYATLSWTQIIGLRNLLIHEYFEVKLEIIWEIIQYDLPPLQVEIETILKDLTEDV